MKYKLALLLALCLSASRIYAETTPEEVIAESGIPGGLIVSVGSNSIDYLAKLKISPSFTVAGFAQIPAGKIMEIKKSLADAEHSGRVTIDFFDGKSIPLIDNLAQFVIIPKTATDLKIPVAEITRVLAPYGVLILAEGNNLPGLPDAASLEKCNMEGVSGWTVYKKKYPEDMGDWEQFLHGPDNNAVAHDRQVSTPFHIQWLAAPEFARDHGRLASTSGVVSSDGRIYAVIDEGPIFSVLLPAKWKLVARDAFSGILLWKRDLGVWEGHLRPFRSGPAELPRRLVAADGKVYATLSYGGPVEEIDGETGKTLKKYRGTENTCEIVYDKGVLFLVRGLTERKGNENAPFQEPFDKNILAVDAGTGKIIWERKDNAVKCIMPLTLSVSSGKLYYQDTQGVYRLDAATGKQEWFTARKVELRRQAWEAPTLVVANDVVLSADINPKPEKKKSGGKKGKKKGKSKTGRKAGKKKSVPEEKVAETAASLPVVTWGISPAAGSNPGKLIAYSADSGKELWSCAVTEGYNAPIDVFYADGLVWYSNSIKLHNPTYNEGRDLHTGEIKRKTDTSSAWTEEHHQRCHRNKATDRFVITGRQGIELLPLNGDKPTVNYWTRGVCQYGILPCNGLIYTPSHACSCYIQAKLHGFNALAGRRKDWDTEYARERLEKGPAYGRNDSANFAVSASEWPTYRASVSRSGYVKTSVPTDSKLKWSVQLEGFPTAPVAAAGVVCLAVPDKHKVSAFSAADGSKLWDFTAGGRVDSPPTLYRGLALFGCHDGWIYAVNLSDGTLVWRFFAAKNAMKHVAFEQLESPWPSVGSVLIKDNVLYSVAGRSSYTDGGMILWRLNPETGEVLGRKSLFDLDVKTGSQKKENVIGLELAGSLPDPLASFGDNLFLRDYHMDMEGNRRPYDTYHIFSNIGFLNDKLPHRGYAEYGKRPFSGASDGFVSPKYLPTGYFIVEDADTLFGFDRNEYIPKDKGFVKGDLNIYRAEKKLIPLQGKIETKKNKGRAIVKLMKPTKVKYLWKEDAPLIAFGAALTENALFLAGTDFADGTSAVANAVLADRQRTSRIIAISKRDGKVIKTDMKITGLPVHDGLIASDGKLIVTTQNHLLNCYGK